MPEHAASALRRLEADDLLRRSGDRWRTTRRWQGAMARAAIGLMRAGDPGDDLRRPIVGALLELYGASVPSEEIADLVEAMIPIEARELSGAPAP